MKLYYFIFGMLESYRHFTTTIIGEESQKAYDAGRKFAHSIKKYWDIYVYGGT